MSRPKGFSLIELLVVVSIIALLIGILLPALSAARQAAKVTQCLSAQRQLLIAVHAYAGDHHDRIPSNPLPATGFFYYGNTQANTILYLGPPDDALVGLGPLLEGYLTDERAFYCADDDSNDPTEELENIRTRSDNAFSSYFYRQLDRTQRDVIHDLGLSNPNLRASVLLLDANFLLPAPQRRTNHANRTVNLGYTDGHAETAENQSGDGEDGVFSIRASDPMGSMSEPFAGRLDEILIAGDVALSDNPASAPPAVTPWP